jgi:uncharacterized protein YdaU (DUF1376 family)
LPSKADIWMPLYIGDYLADTSHLDAQRHGCYLLWMMHYWRKGPLSNNLEDLIWMGKIKGPDTNIVALALLKEFFSLEEDGLWHQKRLDIEREKAQGQKRRGVAGANAKWGINDDGKGKADRSQRLAEARRKGTHTEQEWLHLQAFCRHLCVRCEAGNCELVRDHIVPIYKEGSDSIDNIQPLCRKCNASKGPETTDFRPNGWQDACKMPANVVPNGWTSPSPSPSPNTLKAKKQKPSRGKREITSDPRHQECKELIRQYWDGKNTDFEMTWNGTEGTALADLLSANPKMSHVGFGKLINHRARSECNHSERPSKWLRMVVKYANGPLDKYGNPLSGGGKSNGKVENNGTAIQQAFNDIAGSEVQGGDIDEVGGNNVVSGYGGESAVFPTDGGKIIEGKP